MKSLAEAESVALVCKALEQNMKFWANTSATHPRRQRKKD
jgi:hypothetical protein